MIQRLILYHDSCPLSINSLSITTSSLHHSTLYLDSATHSNLNNDALSETESSPRLRRRYFRGVGAEGVSSTRHHPPPSPLELRPPLFQTSLPLFHRQRHHHLHPRLLQVPPPRRRTQPPIGGGGGGGPNSSARRRGEGHPRQPFSRGRRRRRRRRRDERNRPRNASEEDQFDGDCTGISIAD